MKTLIKYGPRNTEIHFQPSPDQPQLLRITRKSDVSGKDNTLDLPVTEDQLRNWLGTPDRPGQLIQHVMPHLNLDQREFLISGCTPEEWAKVVGEEA
jgi:hypothetical protein